MTIHRTLLALTAGVLAAGAAVTVAASQARAPGDWPSPRQNGHLTAVQPRPGAMRSAPQVVARVTFPRGRAGLVPFASRPGGEPDRAAAIVDGRLQCYRLDGELLWDLHPP